MNKSSREIIQTELDRTLASLAEFVNERTINYIDNKNSARRTMMMNIVNKYLELECAYNDFFNDESNPITPGDKMVWKGDSEADVWQRR